MFVKIEFQGHGVKVKVMTAKKAGLSSIEYFLIIKLLLHISLRVTRFSLGKKIYSLLASSTILGAAAMLKVSYFLSIVSMSLCALYDALASDDDHCGV